MNAFRPNEAGIPRGPNRALPPRTVSDATGGPQANDAKSETLRRRNLQRYARTLGLELRHSAHGYALIDAARNRIDDRNDMTLKEVESRLGAMARPTGR
jgi:hypothetical protein